MAKSDSPVHQRAASRRCAIYTRKSSEEGLEQDFNSLHAQREACEAYIRSQKHEGWVALPALFDDGGISGGTMNRPALQRLLLDIRAGEIQTVVVYKVDRLTRSLADFAKIVDIFDAHGVAFVSVTQQFNTTTSMGRLTLNVLLSFAQFEREVAGERIRDKIAASKRRGMWMGGNVPLGYDVRDRKLIVNEPEADTVRHIYCRYLALRSVRLLKDELASSGVDSKRRVAPGGVERGGVPFSRGALYLLLQNRIYLGEVRHKECSYPGQHAPIIDRAMWDAVQALVASKAGNRTAATRVREPSLLAGLLHDPAGRPMTPTHAVKTGKRYRYYVSRPLLTETRANAADALRLPAAEVERVVLDQVQAWLSDPAAIADAEPSTGIDKRKALLRDVAELASEWPNLLASEHRRLIVALVSRADINSGNIDVHLLPNRLRRAVQLWRGQTPDPVDGRQEQHSVLRSVPARLRRIEKSGRLMLSGAEEAARQLNIPLIKLLARAHQLQSMLMAERPGSFDELARRASLTPKRAAWVLRLSWLSPSITEAILQGKQPGQLTANKLVRMSRLPMDWREQQITLGLR